MSPQSKQNNRTLMIKLVCRRSCCTCTASPAWPDPNRATVADAACNKKGVPVMSDIFALPWEGHVFAFQGKAIAFQGKAKVLGSRLPAT